MGQLNLLQPEFAINVGDMIEGYSDDPELAQEMLAEFMADEAVVAGLSRPVEFDAEQIAFVEDALAKNTDARWTFLFLHEPAWEDPSDSFMTIQAMLKGRKHTVFAGHLHYYDYDLIDGHEYITMGPAGASFHHEGPGNVRSNRDLVQHARIRNQELVKIGAEPGEPANGVANLDGMALRHRKNECRAQARIALRITELDPVDSLASTRIIIEVQRPP